MRSIVIGGIATAPSTTATNYIFMHATNISTWSATESSRTGIIPHALTLSSLQVSLTGAPGGTASWTFTVRKNGADTTLTCTITGSATTGNDFKDNVSFAAGDTIDLEVIPSGSPAAPTQLAWSAQQSASLLFGVLGGSASNVSNSAASFNGLQANFSWNSTESKIYSPMPTAGTFKNLYVSLGSAPGAGTSYTFTLLKNSVATALTTTVSGTGTTSNDTTDTVTVGAGDTVSIQATPTGTPGSAPCSWALSFAPTIDGQSFFLYGDGSTTSSASVEYEQPLGRATTAWGTTQTGRTLPLQAGTLGALYVLLSSTPGAAKSYVFGVQQNGVTTALATTISGSNSTGNFTTNISVANGDNFGLIATPSGSPSSLTVHTGILYAMDQGFSQQQLLGMGTF